MGVPRQAYEGVWMKELLREFLSYDPDSGDLTWIKSPAAKYYGEFANLNDLPLTKTVGAV